ncbi:hypothetical protein KEM56_002928 [Ascosphaera pollenicola]|nr:hypothetical protein KEM56_002928 [Ascosphaera pollenicola]
MSPKTTPINTKTIEWWIDETGRVAYDTHDYLSGENGEQLEMPEGYPTLSLLVGVEDEIDPEVPPRWGLFIDVAIGFGFTVEFVGKWPTFQCKKTHVNWKPQNSDSGWRHEIYIAQMHPHEKLHKVIKDLAITTVEETKPVSCSSMTSRDLVGEMMEKMMAKGLLKMDIHEFQQIRDLYENKWKVCAVM